MKTDKVKKIFIYFMMGRAQLVKSLDDTMACDSISDLMTQDIIRTKAVVFNQRLPYRKKCFPAVLQPLIASHLFQRSYTWMSALNLYLKFKICLHHYHIMRYRKTEHLVFFLKHQTEIAHCHNPYYLCKQAKVCPKLFDLHLSRS